MRLWEKSRRDKAKRLFSFIRSTVGSRNEWPLDIGLNYAVRELCYLSSHEELRRLADDAWLGLSVGFARVARSNVTTLEEFEQSFEHYIQSKSPQNATHIWKFYLPFYAKRMADVPRPTRIRIRDTDFWFLTLSTVLRQVPRKEFMMQATTSHFAGHVDKINVPKLYLVASSQGHSWRSAWKQVEPAFDILRGLFEFTVGFGGWHYGSHPQPRRKVPHPPWIAAQRPGMLNTFEANDFLVEPYPQRELFELTGEAFAILKKNAKVFRTVPMEKSTPILLANCLRLYVQALDARFTHHCLVGLWQLAEEITLAEQEGGQTQTVVSRLAWHTSGLGPKGMEFDQILRTLAHKRNDIVHRGIHNVSDEDVNTLKYICEIAMMWLFRAHPRLFTVRHVREFYTFRTKNSADLRIVEQVVRYVREQRR